MPSSPAATGRRPAGRARKKQKRLDAIVDRPAPSLAPTSDDDDAALLRRSSRTRRAPVLLDSSPAPSPRKPLPSPGTVVKTERGNPTTPSTGESGDWRSRLRDKLAKGRDTAESPNPASSEGKERAGFDSRRKRKRALIGDELVDSETKETEAASFPSARTAKASPEEEIKIGSDLLGDCEPDKELETGGVTGEVREEAEQVQVDGQSVPDRIENVGSDGDAVGEEHPDSMAAEVGETLKLDNTEPPVSDDKHAAPCAKEGRRCGLCGGGTEGRPPKRLDHEPADSDKEAYEGASASEEPNYNTWDGFGDEPGWLGKLLGPIHDRFGIARVWVHQHCAVWSPEVYFAGLGCMKNVRAALFRGRALKCNRCGRPGATIGCRVDRCPKTYHLPCSRADGCIFDHKKFLIACYDHRHLFQPRGNDYSQQIKKMKAKKLKLSLRKLSNDAWRKDLEAEEKWLENCGEDEEFLKREGKRLHRDILRIAPVYIGGSSESQESYQGWDSVAGLQDVIQCMKEVVILPLLYPEFFSTLGLTPPRGILLHGYPGTGKTLVVRALIGACSRGDRRIAYFARKGADCLGKYVGDAERQLRLLFQVAEKCQPSIIFFDEIDGLAPRRSRNQDQTHCSVVSTLLSLLDGLKSRGSVIVIGATNRPEAIDSALRRPGRFDREIYFPLPSEKDRSAILALHTRSWPNSVSGSLLSWIANQTAGYAGADLQSLCTQAAMNALKRNCALQELLSNAEKGFGHDRLPTLPSFTVEERDWLTALAFAPPPCSRRDAGSAANDVVSSPLQPHLVPCLLQPLSQLLVSFYIDDRIWLPPRLFRASESIKSAVISTLEQKNAPIDSWWSHLPYLIEEPYLANKIERGLYCHGLITGPSGLSQCDTLCDDNSDPEKFDLSKLELSSDHTRSKSVQKFHTKLGNSLGFRALISGTPKSGQKHLAGCLLHGYRGHIEIQKVTLATISQEGHGDLTRGLAHILSKCLTVGPCVIYMPRLDLWAIDKNIRHEVEEDMMTRSTSVSSPTPEVPDSIKSVSEAWNSFVEHMDSACTSQSIIILATCEVQNNDLPLGIRQFFTCDVLDITDSVPSEHSIPRFFVHIDGNFNHDHLISSSAVKLSHDLVRYYVQLVHYRAHMSNFQDKNRACNSTEVVCEAEEQNPEDIHIPATLNTTIDSERIASNGGASGINEQTQQGLRSDQRWSLLSQIRSLQEVDIQLRNNQDSFPRVLPSKVMKGGSMLAITTFGYQILSYPQFSELCWVTSKLKGGPSANANGPWKRWPFNSCVTYPGSTLDKVVDGVNSNALKDKEHTNLVRGLVAVGLLAYRGVYTSVREVSFEVRNVLELLVGHIRAKMLGRKDRYRYFQLLSQVAYLEDIVNSWAYTFQSLQTDNQTTVSNTKPMIKENLSNSVPVDNQSSVPTVPSTSCNIIQEVSHKGNSQKFGSSNGHCANFSNGNAGIALLNSDAIMVPEANQFQTSSSHPSSSLAAFGPVNGDGPFPSERTEHNKLNGLEVLEKNSDEANVCNFDRPITVTKSCSGEIRGCHNGLANSSEIIPEEPVNVSDFSLGKNNLSAVPVISCLYECCSECLQAVYMLAHTVLSDCWKSNGHCSALDDIHDVVSSCSLNLLAAIGKCCTSQSNCKSAEFSGRKQHHVTQSDHCACQEVGDKHHRKSSGLHNSSRSITFLPIECSCHSRNKEDNAAISSERNSHFRPPLCFFFRDGVLIPSIPQKDAVFHCKFEKLCICSVLDTMLMIKQPVD